ncbi:family 16 glycosylhydrolase [Mesorhizobium sp. ANAO-SY3R2]|uniref:glycoside hydrolase family 16 protein n=1 Tax=Mesorhizobium sp. ANAO-SY3R2 TaxID=3166644 RepID=UPI00366FB1EF
MGIGYWAAVLTGLACAAGAGGLPTSEAAANSPPYLLGGDWVRVFSDEFDGSALDRSKWTTCYWWDDGGCTNLANNELQWYQRRNVSVADGNLRLTALPETVIGHEGKTFAYTSGMVTSGRLYAQRAGADRFAARQGYFEIRAKIPRGKGLWPAFWLLPSTQDARPEIDIMEVIGNAPDVLEMHLHYTDEKGQKQSVGSNIRTVDLSADWHVYGLEWRPDAVIWYLDGKEAWRYQNAPGIPNEPMYLLLNLAVGGDWPGAPDDKTVFPAEFLVDYVRVWQRGD